MESWPYGREMEQAPLMTEYIQNYDKTNRIEEQPHNSLEEQPKSIEEYAEPLPVAQPLSSSKIQYKKSGSQYRMFSNETAIFKMQLLFICVFFLDMTICHFKICNMGRKRDTQHQQY